MINMSIGLGLVPCAWRTAVITPVPKCTSVNSAGDLRPISLTPICTVERLIVEDHIFSLIPTDKLFDQYGFKKTGSTAAAIIVIMHKIYMLLETNKFVRCLLIDFSKAFDSVDHIILINKLKSRCKFIGPREMLH